MHEIGTRAVISGGKGDLAHSIATHLIEQGFEVKTPGRAQLDVTQADSIREYFMLHQADLLICNAGITSDSPLIHLTESQWDEVLAVNLRGSIRCAAAAIESMKGRGGGSIVLISSYSAIHPPIGQSAYATAKAALLGYIKELAAETGKHNVRVNAILPGFLDTRMTKTVRKQRKEEILEEHSLQRFNTKQAVASFICFLHQQLPHTSGQVFQLDSRLQ